MRPAMVSSHPCSACCRAARSAVSSSATTAAHPPPRRAASSHSTAHGPTGSLQSGSQPAPLESGARSPPTPRSARAASTVPPPSCWIMVTGHLAASTGDGGDVVCRMAARNEPTLLARRPALPPNRRASCVGVSGAGFSSVRSPVAGSTISLPSWLGSRGRFGRGSSVLPQSSRDPAQYGADPVHTMLSDDSRLLVPLDRVIFDHTLHFLQETDEM